MKENIIIENKIIIKNNENILEEFLIKLKKEKIFIDGFFINKPKLRKKIELIIKERKPKKDTIYIKLNTDINNRFKIVKSTDSRYEMWTFSKNDKINKKIMEEYVNILNDCLNKKYYKLYMIENEKIVYENLKLEEKEMLKIKNILELKNNIDKKTIEAIVDNF